MKKVYFGCAIRGGKEGRAIAQIMTGFIKNITGVELYTEFVADNDPPGALAKRLNVEQRDLTDELIETTDMGLLNGCTHAVFEVSGSSTGVGIEIGHARSKHTMGLNETLVLCLYDRHVRRQVSAMVLGMTPDRYPNVLVMPYDTSPRALHIIHDFLS